MREVIDAAANFEEWRTDEIARQVPLTERQVREHLHTLQERGYLEARHERRGFTWRDTGLHRVSDHGEVDFETVDIGEMSKGEVAKVARNSIDSWEFRNPLPEHGDNDYTTDSNGTGAVLRADLGPVDGVPPPG